MKILFCWTGVTSYMADCWRALRKEQGVELRIVVERADSGKAFAAEKTFAGLDYVIVDRRPDLRKLDEALSAFVPDVVFAGGWRSPTTRHVLAKYRRVTRIFCLDMPWRWSPRCFFARFALRSFVRQFDAVYVPGASTAFYAHWLGFRKDRIYRKLYAIDQGRFRAAVGGERRSGFLYIGRYSPEKRIDVIERAYARYREMGGAWSIDYYGQGGKFVQAEGMPQVYAEHACLLLASGFDPWPLVMLEARSAGLEVIASDRCGNCDELRAFKVPYGDVEAMARQMLSVERGERRPAGEDLGDYDCLSWVRRTLRIAQEVLACR